MDYAIVGVKSELPNPLWNCVLNAKFRRADSYHGPADIRNLHFTADDDMIIARAFLLLRIFLRSRLLEYGTY